MIIFICRVCKSYQAIFLRAVKNFSEGICFGWSSSNLLWLHVFIIYLASEKDAESFVEELLMKKSLMVL